MSLLLPLCPVMLGRTLRTIWLILRRPMMLEGIKLVPNQPLKILDPAEAISIFSRFGKFLPSPTKLGFNCSRHSISNSRLLLPFELVALLHKSLLGLLFYHCITFWCLCSSRLKLLLVFKYNQPVILVSVLYGCLVNCFMMRSRVIFSTG